jgi:hypothetical protein
MAAWGIFDFIEISGGDYEKPGMDMDIVLFTVIDLIQLFVKTS